MFMASFDILVLPGDGIGPEVTAEGVRMLELVGDRFEHVFRLTHDTVGGACIDAHGIAIRPETIQAARDSDAVLFGAVGGPKWDDPTAPVRPEQGLLALRSELDLWANLRPIKAIPALLDASSIKRDVLEGTDIMVIRELTSGAYFGQPKERRTESGLRVGVDTIYYREDEVERVARLGFKLARERRNKLTSVDKANVLESSRLWREIVHEVREEFPDVEYEDVLVDAMTMHLIRRPRDFDVVIAGNMFGDIITDEGSMLIGSMGMLASASLSTPGRAGTALGMYEPIHGSAPDIMGQGIANPLAMILCTAMLLRHSCGLEEEAQAVEQAVADVIDAGLRSPDLGGGLGTVAMADAVLVRLGG
jgi:3-isopropylmalate dehydrogenase